MAEGGWEEIMEKAVLPAEGFWYLLCSQRKSQGVCLYTGRTAWRIQTLSIYIDFLIGRSQQKSFTTEGFIMYS